MNSTRPTRNVPMDIAAPFAAPRPRQQGRDGLSQEVPIYPPDLYPIPAATEFNPLASKATAAIEAGVDIGLVLVVPANSVGVLRGVSLYINDMLATTNVTFTVSANNGPLPGFSNLRIFPRVAPFVSNGFDALVRLPNGPVTVTFNNNDGGSYVVGVALSGWTWPESAGREWMTSGIAL